MAQQLIIFDWDGTLAIPESGETFRKQGEKYQWIKGEQLHSNRKELLEHLYYSLNAQIAVATNQGGIAYGIIGLEDTKDKIFALLKELDFYVPFLVSPYHEKKPSLYRDYYSWRKPNSGMLALLWQMFPDIEVEDVIVVGDRQEDEDAAVTAGFRFEQADTFFLNIQHDLEADIAAEQNAGENFDNDSGRPYDPNYIPF